MIIKIKSKVGLGLLLSSVAIPVFAWNASNDHNSNKGYESSFGNRYEYNLSNPSDSLRYETDPSAQLRDSIDVNPTRGLERGVGQYGGGAYRE